ncbi:MULTISPECIES: hypothetical protein [Nocardia]|uniref:hypothetical protein n=1 Tax=Nocardia TaxID=1817 RepID=UPI000D6899A4|nr:MULTISPECIES: hypothetical protein [Nocardia]
MSVSPPPNDGQTIVGVVEYWARRWPDKKPPMFRAADVLPLLHGDDREYAAAVTLLDSGRVHYAEGEEPS